MANTIKKTTKTQRNLDIISILTLCADRIDTSDIAEMVHFGTTIDEAISHLYHEIALLDKKNSKLSNKLTATQRENEDLKMQILTYLSEYPDGVTATDVCKALGLSSNQKASALLRALKEAGRIEKTSNKGKSIFSIIPNHQVKIGGLTLDEVEENPENIE